MLRPIRQNADDIGLVMRLNAQYPSMLRTSLSVQGRLMRVQAVRQKRGAIEDAAAQDAWTLHTAEQSMLQVADPAAEPQQPTAPAPGSAEKTTKNVSENEAISQGVAFETWLNAQPWNRGPTGSAETGLRAVRETMADPH